MCISKDDNITLRKPYSEEETINALKSISPLKAPGIDGFSTLFFQRCWHIVGNEVSRYILGVLNGSNNLEPINVTNIVLIPKLRNLFNMAKFQTYQPL